MRGNQQAQQAATSGLGFSRVNQGQAGSVYGTLAPQLTADVVNPQGMNPTDKAALRTSNMQTLGGSEAGAVGQGALQAARTRNQGSTDAAVQEGARGAGRGLANANLSTELADQELKQRKQAAAKSELGQLYGIGTQGANQALGETANNVNANTQAAHQSWDWASQLFDPILGAASRPLTPILGRIGQGGGAGSYTGLE